MRRPKKQPNENLFANDFSQNLAGKGMNADGFTSSPLFRRAAAQSPWRGKDRERFSCSNGRTTRSMPGKGPKEVAAQKVFIN
jgi:hypothetical protein